MFCAMLMCFLKLGHAYSLSETGMYCAMLMCFLKLGHAYLFSKTGICLFAF